MNLVSDILLFLVILLSNIMQGITGFAGTILAMPFSILLIGIDDSKLILNFLGIVASLIIIRKYYNFINYSEFKKICKYMLIGLVIGVLLYQFIALEILLIILPVFIIVIAVKGIIFKGEKLSDFKPWLEIVILILAGVIHGLFVVGGPLLIIYATRKFEDKQVFRVTLSLVWLVLNSLLFILHITTIKISLQLLYLLAISTIALVIGVKIGDYLVSKMSQKLFMKITYVLLLISGISILI